MTTGSEWRTDRPEVGRVIETRDGRSWFVGMAVEAVIHERDAQQSPETDAWRYCLSARDARNTAADIGTACAWVEVFARVVVPLGSKWVKGRPSVGRLVEGTDGEQCHITHDEWATAWHEWSHDDPSNGWRYID